MSARALCVPGLLLSCLLWGQNQKSVIPAPPNPTRFVTEKKLALIVGINDYLEESGLSRLNFAVQDAQDLGKALQAHGYTVDVLANDRAMKVPIRRHLEDLLKKVDGDSGTILFAYSGHGGQIGKEQYLATYDSSAETLGSEGLSVSWIEDQLAASKAARKMMFVDACRNVTTPGAKAAGSPLTPLAGFSTSAGLRILVSTGPDTISYEDPEYKHGIFTYFLLKGLEGAAALPNGLITFESLTQYVTAHVKERRPAQVPYSAGEWTGDFYVAGEYKEPVAISPSGSGDKLDEEAWMGIRESKDPRVFQRFMKEFPDSPWLRVASLRIEALTSSGLNPAPSLPPQAPAGGESAVAAKIVQLYDRARLLDKQGDAREALRNYSEAFDLGRQAIAAMPAGQPRPESLSAGFITAAYYYAWYLLDIKDPAAETILHYLENLVGSYDSFSLAPGLLLPYARFENLESRYYSDHNSDAEDERHNLRCFELSLRAASQPGADLETMRAADVLVQNRLRRVKGVEREEIQTKVCAIADLMMAANARDRGSVTARIDCLRSQARVAGEKQNFDAAIEQLETASQIVSVLNITPDPDLLLSLANVENEIANLTWGDGKDAARKQHRLAAKAYFVKAIAGKTMFESATGQFESLYRNIQTVDFANADEELAFYKEIRDAVDPSLQAFPQSRSFALVAGDASLHIGDLMYKDSPVQAEPWLTQALTLYDRIGALKDLSAFSEDFAAYCGIYNDRARAYRIMGQLDQAVADIKKQKTVCSPALEKYPWDFYLRMKLINANAETGQALFEVKRYKDALPYIEFASHWGIGDSSKLLARMYREALGVPQNAAKARDIENLATKQDIVSFSIPIDAGGFKWSYRVYVREWPADYPFEGVDDQIAWLKEARGAIVPPEVGENYRKLQRMAREKKVGFPEMCKSNPPK